MQTSTSPYEGSIILQLTADIIANHELQDGFRYVPISQYTNAAGEDILISTGQRDQFQIVNIYNHGLGFGLRTEISAIRKMQQMLQNGNPQWGEMELLMMEELCRLSRKDEYTEYVSYLLSFGEITFFL